ncbi:hypothetical protein BR93DRAFT_938510 [Coniochaeta sp. PMI_546]|nr:hypothetical protein BR93DRAFT_938510 [Coniochaeta sp. PMI_546]
MSRSIFYATLAVCFLYALGGVVDYREVITSSITYSEETVIGPCPLLTYILFFLAYPYYRFLNTLHRIIEPLFLAMLEAIYMVCEAPWWPSILTWTNDDIDFSPLDLSPLHSPELPPAAVELLSVPLWKQLLFGVDCTAIAEEEIVDHLHRLADRNTSILRAHETTLRDYTHTCDKMSSFLEEKYARQTKNPFLRDAVGRGSLRYVRPAPRITQIVPQVPNPKFVSEMHRTQWWLKGAVNAFRRPAPKPTSELRYRLPVHRVAAIASEFGQTLGLGQQAVFPSLPAREQVTSYDPATTYQSTTAQGDCSGTGFDSQPPPSQPLGTGVVIQTTGQLPPIPVPLSNQQQNEPEPEVKRTVMRNHASKIFPAPYLRPFVPPAGLVANPVTTAPTVQTSASAHIPTNVGTVAQQQVTVAAPTSLNPAAAPTSLNPPAAPTNAPKTATPTPLAIARAAAKAKAPDSGNKPVKKSNFAKAAEQAKAKAKAKPAPMLPSARKTPAPKAAAPQPPVSQPPAPQAPARSALVMPLMTYPAPAAPAPQPPAPSAMDVDTHPVPTAPVPQPPAPSAMDVDTHPVPAAPAPQPAAPQPAAPQPPVSQPPAPQPPAPSALVLPLVTYPVQTAPAPQPPAPNAMDVDTHPVPTAPAPQPAAPQPAAPQPSAAQPPASQPPVPSATAMDIHPVSTAPAPSQQETQGPQQESQGRKILKARPTGIIPDLGLSAGGSGSSNEIRPPESFVFKAPIKDLQKLPKPKVKPEPLGVYAEPPQNPELRKHIFGDEEPPLPTPRHPPPKPASSGRRITPEVSTSRSSKYSHRGGYGSSRGRGK